MILKWLTEDKRDPPSAEDFQNLVIKNIEEIEEKVNDTDLAALQQQECLKDLSRKLDIMIDHVHKNDKATNELLDAFHFHRKVRKLVLGVVSGLVMLLAVWDQSSHFIERITALLTGHIK